MEPIENESIDRTPAAEGGNKPKPAGSGGNRKVLYKRPPKSGTPQKVFRIVGIVLAVILVFVIAFFVFISVTEYKPEERTKVEFASSGTEFEGNMLDIVTLNAGYAGLGNDMDFFMDGGKGVNPESKEKVEENLKGINDMIDMFDPDICFIQEIDKDSSRSYHIDQTAQIQSEYAVRAYAQNFVCKWIPYPLPMIGSVDSGIMTLSKYKMADAERVSLPGSFDWPKSLFLFKRCLLVNRIPIKGSDKQIVLVNFHLEAYSENSSKEAQTKVLMNLLDEEYKKGNYVIAGGDFNQTLPGMSKKLQKIEGDEIWRPGKLKNSMLPSDEWQFAYDSAIPTCRSLDKPFEGLDGHQLYSLDGFVLSPNVKVDFLCAANCNFHYTDHNPVYLRVILE